MAQSRQEQRGQDRDDGNHDENFNQGEGSSMNRGNKAARNVGGFDFHEGWKIWKEASSAQSRLVRALPQFGIVIQRDKAHTNRSRNKKL